MFSSCNLKAYIHFCHGRRKKNFLRGHSTYSNVAQELMMDAMLGITTVIDQVHLCPKAQINDKQKATVPVKLGSSVVHI